MVDINMYKGHLDIIRSHIRNQKAVLFVGAGLSLNAEPQGTNLVDHFKTWPEFMEQLAGLLWHDLYTGNRNAVDKRLAGNQLLIAQWFQEEYGVDAFYAELRKALPIESYKPSPVHHQILSMPWKHIVTTNQDDLIERTLNAQFESFDVVITDSDIPTKNRRKKLYKIHGSIESPSTIVFTEEQYRTYEQNHPLMFVTLKSLFAENTVIFVGYSLTDPDFKLIHGWVSDVLGRDLQRKAYAFVFSDQLDPLLVRYWQARNIVVLPIETAGYSDRGRAFSSEMSQYIQYLSGIQDTPGEPSAVDRFCGRYTDVESIDFTEMIRDLATLSVIDPEGDYARLHSVFVRLISDVDKLDEIDKYHVLAAWSLFVNPLIRVSGDALIDFLLKALDQHPTWDTQTQLWNYMMVKIHSLAGEGKYAEAADFGQEFSRSHPDLPTQNKNEIVFMGIVAAKFDWELDRVLDLVNELEVDWDEPKWLNRVGNVHAVLGDSRTAYRYFRRALQVASETRDAWSEYVALQCLMSSTNILSDWQTARDLSNKLIAAKRKLSESLPQDQRYQQLVDLDGLKDRWAEYQIWKREHDKEGDRSFNTETANLLHDYLHLVRFVEDEALPDSYLTGTQFDRVASVYFDHGLDVEGIKQSLYFGRKSTIANVLSFSSLADLEEGKRDDLVTMCEGMYGRLYQWLDRGIASLRDPAFMGRWFGSLAQLWALLMPRMLPNEIYLVQQHAVELFQKLNGYVQLDQSGETRRLLIKVAGMAFYYEEGQDLGSDLIKLVEIASRDPRLSVALPGIPWGNFTAKLTLSPETQNNLLSNHPALLYWLLVNDIVTGDHAEVLAQQILGEAPSIIVQESAFLFLGFLKDSSSEVFEAAVATEVSKFSKEDSSRDPLKLDFFARVADALSSNQVDELLKACERKIARAKTEPLIVYSGDEIATAFLTFLARLVDTGSAPPTYFFEQSLKHQEQLNRQFAAVLSVFRRYDNDIDVAKMLTAGIQSTSLMRHQHCAYLAGEWLKNLSGLIPSAEDLWDVLIGGTLDSNPDVAAVHLRAVASVIGGQPDWISDNMERIVKLTKGLVDRRHTPFLSSMACLYRQMEKFLSLDDSLKEAVTVVISRLSEMQFGNVRRELRR